MGGLSFIQLGFLATGLAVVVPIAIHLLFRQKARLVSIGSIRFLQQVVREHRRQRRVRQWLLLLLRMLAIACLALLFARPYFNQAARQAHDTEVVVLLDASASMEARDGTGETSFARALERAETLLTDLDENVITHVALCDSTGARELPLASWRDSAMTSEAATDYGLALAWARDVLATSPRSRQRVVLVGDAQRTGVTNAPSELLPRNVEFQFYDVGAALAPNLAVTAAEVVRAEIRPGEPLIVRATLRNFAPLPARDIAVSATVEASGDSTSPKLTVTRSTEVAGRGTARVDLPFEIVNDGLYRVEVTVKHEDALAIDNRRWLAFEARRPDRVLLVDGQEGRFAFANETYFLETVLRLRPADSVPRHGSLEVERIVWEAGEGFPRLDGYRAVVLANVRTIRAEDARRLRDFLNSGGGVLFFAGDQVTRSTLQPLTDAGIHVGDIPIGPRDERLRVTAWSEEHPIFLPLSDPQHGDLRRLECHQSLPLERLAANARALLSSGPLVLAAEAPIGRGRFIYFGTTADRAWTEWPRTRLYVPLVRQLLAYLTRQLEEKSAVETRIVAKAGDKVGIEVERSESQESENQGIAAEPRLIVTNLDPRESSLDRLEPDQLRESLGQGPSNPGERAQAAGIPIVPPADALRADELWTILVWMLLAILAVETLLASRVHA